MKAGDALVNDDVERSRINARDLRGINPRNALDALQCGVEIESRERLHVRQVEGVENVGIGQCSAARKRSPDRFRNPAAIIRSLALAPTSMALSLIERQRQCGGRDCPATPTPQGQATASSSAGARLDRRKRRSPRGNVQFQASCAWKRSPQRPRPRPSSARRGTEANPMSSVRSWRWRICAARHQNRCLLSTCCNSRPRPSIGRGHRTTSRHTPPAQARGRFPSCPAAY